MLDARQGGDTRFGMRSCILKVERRNDSIQQMIIPRFCDEKLHSYIHEETSYPHQSLAPSYTKFTSSELPKLRIRAQVHIQTMRSLREGK